MAEQSVPVTAAITPNNWTLAAGASKVAAVAGPDDEATTFIHSGTANNTQQQFSVGDLTDLAPASRVTNVRIRARVSRGATTNTVTMTLTGLLGGNTLSSSGLSAPADTAWHDRVFDMPTRPGGGEWEAAQIPTLQVRLQNTQARNLRCTTLELRVTVLTTYNLSGPMVQILTSWLFEPDGYLDSAVNSAGLSARQALAAEPALDVAHWIRTQTPDPSTDPDTWEQTGLVWWLRTSQNVDIPVSARPPEAARWRQILAEWKASIEEAFTRVGEEARDGSVVTVYAEDGTTTTLGSGLHLRHQLDMCNRVLPVLS